MSGLIAGNRAVQIRNERTKLIANALDRASTTVGAGSLLPLLNITRPIDGRLTAPVFIQFTVGFWFFISFAIVLHYLARRALGGLR